MFKSVPNYHSPIYPKFHLIFMKKLNTSIACLFPELWQLNSNVFNNNKMCLYRRVSWIKLFAGMFIILATVLPKSPHESSRAKVANASCRMCFEITVADTQTQIKRQKYQGEPNFERPQQTVNQSVTQSTATPRSKPSNYDFQNPKSRARSDSPKTICWWIIVFHQENNGAQVS